MDPCGGFFEDGNGCANSQERWPMQEALTLLEIRFRLDPKFKEATYKAPLWEEISRMMADHGYQRSGKKCKEKLENLNKYYRKIKDGRAGRQDGKSYKFSSQLDALNGDTGNMSRRETNMATSYDPIVNIPIDGPRVVDQGAATFLEHTDTADRVCREQTPTDGSWCRKCVSSSKEVVALQNKIQELTQRVEHVEHFQEYQKQIMVEQQKTMITLLLSMRGKPPDS